MAVYTRIKVNMKPAGTVMKKLGVDSGGAVQQFHTANVLKRIQRFMPKNTGETIKIMVAQTDIRKPLILLNVPYGQFLYNGKLMVGDETGSPWARKYETKHVVEVPLQYNHSKNPLVGPFWDKRLVQAEGKAMEADLQRFIDRRAGK